MGLQATIDADIDSIFANDFILPSTHVNGAINETINVLFDRSREIILEGDMSVTTEQPSIFVRTVDMTNIDRASQFTVETEIYFVLEIQVDIEGMTLIILTQDQAG